MVTCGTNPGLQTNPFFGLQMVRGFQVVISHKVCYSLSLYFYMLCEMCHFSWLHNYNLHFPNSICNKFLVTNKWVKYNKPKKQIFMKMQFSTYNFFIAVCLKIINGKRKLSQNPFEALEIYC